jgi:hypothetical protein
MTKHRAAGAGIAMIALMLTLIFPGGEELVVSLCVPQGGQLIPHPNIPSHENRTVYAIIGPEGQLWAEALETLNQEPKTIQVVSNVKVGVKDARIPCEEDEGFIGAHSYTANLNTGITKVT